MGFFVWNVYQINWQFSYVKVVGYGPDLNNTI